MPSIRSFLSTSAAVALACAAVVVVDGRPSHADPAREGDSLSPEAPPAGVDPAAWRLYRRGLDHFNAGRYGDAVDDFRASYDVTPSPGLLYNVAQALRLGGDCAGARKAYDEFLATNPPEKIRRRTEARLAELKGCASGPTQPPALAARPPPISSLPPSFAISSGAPASKGGARTASRSFSRRRAGGIASSAAALVFAAAGVYFGVSAGAASDDVSRAVNEARPWDATSMAREREGLRHETWSIGFGAAALVAGAVSAWLLLYPAEQGAP
jgi:hypothetical protein